MLTTSKQYDAGSLELVTPATLDPVTVDEMKAHARLDEVGEGAEFMSAMISAATAAVQEYTRRALLTETWRLTLDRWPGSATDDWWTGVRDGIWAQYEGSSVLIRKAPFVAVSSVKTVAEDGTETTWSSDNWYATTESGFGRLAKRTGQTWPLIVTPVRQVGGIRITFTAGYGAEPQSVPSPIRHAIKMLAAHYYENRELAGSSAELPLTVSSLISKYRVLAR